MITSTPASRSAAARSSVSALVPTAAPTRNAPRSSLQARGNSVAFWKSLTVIMPFSAKSSSTTSTFSMRCLCSRPSTSVLGRILAHRDEPLARRHHRRDGCVVARLEAQVAMRDDADGLAVAHDRHAGDVLRARQLQHFADGRLGAHRDRVVDDAALETLDAGDLAGLLVDRHVLVDDADAAFLGDRDGEPVLRSRCPWPPRRSADSAGCRE